jgi:hypothetical protein
MPRQRPTTGACPSELRDDLEEAERFNDVGRGLRAREEIEAINARSSPAWSARRLRPCRRQHGRACALDRHEHASDAPQADPRGQPPLGDHDERRVKTGVFCAYLPDNASPIEWAPAINVKETIASTWPVAKRRSLGRSKGPAPPDRCGGRSEVLCTVHRPRNAIVHRVRGVASDRDVEVQVCHDLGPRQAGLGRALWTL